MNLEQHTPSETHLDELRHLAPPMRSLWQALESHKSDQTDGSPGRFTPDLEARSLARTVQEVTMDTDRTQQISELPAQPEIPRSQFARGLALREQDPDRMHLGEFAEGQRTASPLAGGPHRGRTRECGRRDSNPQGLSPTGT